MQICGSFQTAMGKLRTSFEKENKRKYCYNCAKKGHFGHVSLHRYLYYDFSQMEEISLGVNANIRTLYCRNAQAQTSTNVHLSLSYYNTIG